MSIIRSDNEADGVEIQKLVVETTDYYIEMADVLEDESIAQELHNIARERASYIQPFEQLVKQLDELPVQPDPERELMQKLGGEITNLFATDSQKAILEKCLREDAKLLDLVSKTHLGEQSPEFQQLLDSLLAHLRNTQAFIHRLKN